jgi:hypothetical protein
MNTQIKRSPSVSFLQIIAGTKSCVDSISVLNQSHNQSKNSLNQNYSLLLNRNDNNLSNLISKFENIKISNEIKLESYQRSLKESTDNLQNLNCKVLSNNYANLEINFNCDVQSLEIDNFIEIAKLIDVSIETEIYQNLCTHYNILKNIDETKKQIKNTFKYICSLKIALFKKRNRNKRQAFRKITSFLFKDLDDYHADNHVAYYG